jgi:hypothetical protein
VRSVIRWGWRIPCCCWAISLPNRATWRARPLLEESVRLFHELGDEDYSLLATVNLAWAHAELGDRKRARLLHEENLERARQLSNARVEAMTLAQLALLAREDGKPSRGTLEVGGGDSHLSRAR